MHTACKCASAHCGLRNGNAGAEKVEMLDGEVFWGRACFLFNLCFKNFGGILRFLWYILWYDMRVKIEEAHAKCK